MASDSSHTDHSQNEWPVAWVVAALMLVVAALGWGFAAASYARAELNWRTGGVQGALGNPPPPVTTTARGRALGDFLGNAIERIPQAPAVFRHVATRAPWLGGLVIVAELALAFFGWKLKRLDQQLSGSDRQPRASRRSRR